jgi:hypothetical protein
MATTIFVVAEVGQARRRARTAGVRHYFTASLLEPTFREVGQVAVRRNLPRRELTAPPLHLDGVAIQPRVRRHRRGR